jgi:solute carrier family 35 protein C2
MCKSSSLIFVLLFALLFRLETFSWRLVFVITLICAGVILMVATETAFHFAGMLMVFSASALGGLRWSLTQILLRKRDMGMDTPVATVFWLAPSMGFTLAFASITIEGWGNVFRLPIWDTPEKTVRALGLLTAPGCLAFAMVLSEY